VCAFVGAVLLTLYAAPELQGRHAWLAMAASFAPYGWLAWVASVILALLGARGRTRLVVAPLALGLAWHTGIVVPYLPGPDRATAAPHASFTVLELNLHYGLADLGVLTADVRHAKPDVMVLAEATQTTRQALAKKPWSQDYPYLLGTAGRSFDARTGEGDSRGTLMVSRHPLTQLGYAEGASFTNVAARVDLPGHPITLIAAHPANPEHGVGTWVQDADAVTRLALQNATGPLVVAGDLNATAEHLTLRELMAKAGLTDTAAGQGWHPTYPADAWYPPLIQIDHVLVSRQFNTVGYRTIRVPGTDHRGLLVQLSVS
jgi:endonuclease/exonuclease/phosphatase (EEP) superfamily protein YafD